MARSLALPIPTPASPPKRLQPARLTRRQVAHSHRLHHVHILELNGDSYRLKQSKRRQRSDRAANLLPDSPPGEE
jgi:hypothetical protein